MAEPENTRIDVPNEERRPRGRPRAFNDKTEQNTIKALDRALIVLETLAEMQGATLTALAERMEQSPATLYRILVTLETRGMVETEHATQTWHIGPGAFLIGSVFLRRTSLVERSRPIMRDLMAATGETANLGVERGLHVLFISQAETHQAIRAFFPPGAMSPLFASGVGKALLSQYGPTAFERYLRDAELEQFTPQTLTDPEALRTDLALTRTRGFSYDDEERNIGMRCIAAPVFNAHGEAVAGISVSGPSSRIGASDLDRLAVAVKTAAARLSAALGAP
ncbi:MAG: HTH-type transcriptional regulator BhcR [Pseudomonadota bacterium]